MTKEKRRNKGSAVRRPTCPELAAIIVYFGLGLHSKSC